MDWLVPVWRIEIGPIRWLDAEVADEQRRSLKAAGATVSITADGDVVTFSLSAPNERVAHLRAARIFGEAVLLDVDAYHVTHPARIEQIG